ncbi:MAG: BamA/TamA family outer membrane protein, partial [Bacteroidota bacterium]
ENDIGEVVKENIDRLFIDFATNMRGFKYNQLSGNNFILLNAELRIPVLKYFYKGTITSNFFRNLQLVGFTDVGSAWTGISPFNRENALNTEIIPERARPGDLGFVARVKNFKNPFLVGYGAGIRTMLLGFYTKFDVAWGIEDETRQDPMYYLTLGHDF